MFIRSIRRNDLQRRLEKSNTNNNKTNNDQKNYKKKQCKNQNNKSKLKLHKNKIGFKSKITKSCKAHNNDIIDLVNEKSFNEFKVNILLFKVKKILLI